MAMISFSSSCRKFRTEHPSGHTQAQLMNVQQGQDILLPFRSINPYSIKTVRTIRNMAAQLQDSALNSPKS